MQKCKLTDKIIDSAVCKNGKFIEYRDTEAPNLYLRVSHYGGKVFSFLYRYNGKQHHITMGDYTVLPLDKARETACDYRLMLYKGIDPKTTIAKYNPQLTAETAHIHLDDAIQKFLYAKQDLRSIRRYKAVLRKIPKKYLRCYAQNINRIIVQEIAKDIKNVSGQCASNYFIRVMKSLYSWLQSEDLIENNTLIHLKQPYKERERGRVLEDDELRMIWHQTDILGYPFGTCIQMLMLTGQRRGEVAKMEWQDIDFKNAMWTIPSSKTKNKKIHKVPLSDVCIRLLNGCPKTSTFVFTTNHKTPVSGFSKPIDRIRDNVQIPHWTLHDIRRTFATNLAKNHDVVEMIISYILITVCITSPKDTTNTHT